VQGTITTELTNKTNGSQNGAHESLVPLTSCLWHIWLPVAHCFLFAVGDSLSTFFCLPWDLVPITNMRWRRSLEVGRRTCDRKVVGLNPGSDAAAKQPVASCSHPINLPRLRAFSMLKLSWSPTETRDIDTEHCQSGVNSCTGHVWTTVACVSVSSAPETLHFFYLFIWHCWLGFTVCKNTTAISGRFSDNFEERRLNKQERQSDTLCN